MPTTALRPGHELALSGARFSAGAAAVILATAVTVWSFAPGSWQAWIEDEQRTDASALTVISIWTNNVLICSLPLLAGVFAHRLTVRGHQGWARVVVALAAMAVIRSLLVIGLVGGLDPAWLAEASPWWVPEVLALGTCCAAGWQAFGTTDPDTAARDLTHALAFAAAALGAAAGAEVALT